MKLYTPGYLILLALLTVIMVCLSLIGCDPVTPIKVKNQTNEVLDIFIFNTNIGQAKPDETIENRIVYAGNSARITAKNKDGREVYKKTYSIGELKDKDYLVVIDQQDIVN